MKVLTILFISIVLTACSPDNEIDEDSINEQNGTEEEVNETETSDEIDEENLDDDETEEPTYNEEVGPATFMIDTQHVNHDDSGGILTLNISRSEEERSLGENLRESLVESDPTSQQVLSTLQEVSIENETEASFNFSSDEQMASMASTEQLLFSDMVNQISSLFGVESIDLYVENEPGIFWGQAGELESIEIEADENRGYYLFPLEEEGIVRYITGISAGEDIHDENGELLDFSETLEEMSTVTAENVERQPGISEVITIHHSTINENQAEVSYSINEEQNAEWTEEDQNHFESILQLTALDFQVEELQLIDEGENTITLFLFK